MITIVIADDHPVARDGIRKTLAMAPDFKIIGEAEVGTDHLVISHYWCGDFLVNAKKRK